MTNKQIRILRIALGIMSGRTQPKDIHPGDLEDLGFINWVTRPDIGMLRAEAENIVMEAILGRGSAAVELEEMIKKGNELLRPHASVVPVDDQKSTISFIDWLTEYLPIGEGEHLTVYPFHILTRDFPNTPIQNFWYKAIDQNGDTVILNGLIPTHHEGVEVLEYYYVTEYQGSAGQVIIVQERNDQIDEINRDNILTTE